MTDSKGIPTPPVNWTSILFLDILVAFCAKFWIVTAVEQLGILTVTAVGLTRKQLL